MEALNRNSILTLTIIMEASLLLISAVWIYFGKLELVSKFSFQLKPILYGFATAGATTLVSIFCLTVGRKFSWLAEMRKMSEELLSPIIRQLNIFDILLLSLLSGFCEEVLFRGVMQAQCGLWISSLSFGFFHDPSLKHKAYVVLAALAGLALGYLYQLSGNLWSSISAHVVHNFIGMLILRFFFRPSNS